VNFSEALTKLYGIEGGYTVDAGGPTRWGVTEAVARANGYTGDMRDYPIESASAIYKPQFWDAVRADDLPDALRYAAFDAAVNSGPHASIKWLQAASGTVADGQLGPASMASIAAENPDRVLRKMCALRLQFMTQLPNWGEDGRGWSRRIASILGA
jgi:lysozyme family protein